MICWSYSLFSRLLQEKLDQPVSEPASPRKENNDVNVDDLSSNVSALRNEVKNLRNQLAQAQAERKFRSVTTLRKFRSVTTFNKSFDQIKRNTKQLLIKNSRKKTWKKTRISADWSSENFQNIDVLYLRYLQGYHHNHQILGLICFLPKKTWPSRWQKNNLIEKPLENI